MTLMPEVETALRSAVSGLQSKPVRRRGMTLRRGLLIAAGTVLVSGSAFAAATKWSPQLGDARRGHPTVADEGIPKDQLAALAVLRRPQTEADRGPQVRRVLKVIGSEETGGIHLDGVRLLASHGDRSLVLVPAQRVGSHQRGFPSTIQRNTLLLIAAGPASAGATRGTASELRARGITVSTSGSISADGASGWTVNGLVPDGVIGVEVTLRGGVVKTATVHNNSYEIPTGGQIGYLRTRWQHADGHFSKPH